QICAFSILASHLRMLPVLLLRLNVPLLAVAHTVSLPATLPGTVGVEMVICTVSLLSTHTPLLTVQMNLYTPGCKLLTLALFTVVLAMMVAVGPLSWLHLPLPLV